LTELAGLHARRTFPKDSPRAGAEQGLAVEPHPGGELSQKLALILIDAAVAAQRDAQQQIAVLGDDVAQAGDVGIDALVAMFLEQRAPIMPLTDAGVGLPGQRPYCLTEAALDVFHHGRTLLGSQILGMNHGFETALVPLAVGIV